MKLSIMRKLMILNFIISFIFILFGKSFVPLACYFLIIAAIVEIMIVEENQYKFKKQDIQSVKVEQIEWIHKELNQVCESNDVDEIKRNLNHLDSQLYLLHHNAKGKGL
ncbi:hypothetical protein E34_1024 [Lactococcus lactis subsp. lactis]|uniref:hypothetical protein n=1 Tax=Lactococcus lactis TaxID=1358 RepID=UPI00072B1228|nr:hypothetical protein [Lactococcus lactis]KST79073.1 hypothetical protein E34_1024 [Lactococcus lactis subsp. lactis]